MIKHHNRGAKKKLIIKLERKSGLISTVWGHHAHPYMYDSMTIVLT